MGEPGSQGEPDTSYAPPGGGTTEERVQARVTALFAQRDAAMATLDALLGQVAANPDLLKPVQEKIEDENGNLVPSGRQMPSVFKQQIEAAEKILAIPTFELVDVYHINPKDGSPLTDEQTETARGNLNARLAELGVRREELQAATARNDQLHQETLDRETRAQRETNIDAVLKGLEAQVRSGELKRGVAMDKARTAIDAAEQARLTTEKFAPLALPAGTQYFPGLEPGSVAANAVRALGGGDFGMKTGGTFAVDPSALGAPAMQAISGDPSVDVEAAYRGAMAALAGLGVPVKGG